MAVKAPGAQTVHVIKRVPIGHGDYEDGTRESFSGCSVQPMPPQEQVQYGLQVTRRWRLYGPPTLRAASQDEVEVDGLVDDDGVTALRMTLQGPPETWIDTAGVAIVVEAMLELIEGATR